MVVTTIVLVVSSGGEVFVSTSVVSVDSVTGFIVVVVRLMVEVFVIGITVVVDCFVMV